MNKALLSMYLYHLQAVLFLGDSLILKLHISRLAIALQHALHKAVFAHGHLYRCAVAYYYVIFPGF